MAPSEISDRLVAQRVVPVLRLASSPDTERAVDCLADAGFRVVEITPTVPALATTGFGAVAPLPRPEAVRKLLGGA